MKSRNTFQRGSIGERGDAFGGSSDEFYQVLGLSHRLLQACDISFTELELIFWIFYWGIPVDIFSEIGFFQTPFPVLWCSYRHNSNRRCSVHADFASPQNIDIAICNHVADRKVVDRCRDYQRIPTENDSSTKGSIIRVVQATRSVLR